MAMRGEFFVWNRAGKLPAVPQPGQTGVKLVVTPDIITTPSYTQSSLHQLPTNLPTYQPTIPQPTPPTKGSLK